DEVKRSFHTIDHQCMTGVVAALEADHGGGPVREQIDDLALALVTPLGAQHNYIFTHAINSGVGSNCWFKVDRLRTAGQESIGSSTKVSPSRHNWRSQRNSSKSGVRPSKPHTTRSPAARRRRTSSRYPGAFIGGA